MLSVASGSLRCAAVSTRLVERLGYVCATFNYRLTLSGASALAQLWLPEHAPDGSLVLATQVRG